MPDHQHHFRPIRPVGPGVPRAMLGFLLASVAALSVALEHGFHTPTLPPLLHSLLYLAMPWAALLIWRDVDGKKLSSRRWNTTFGAISEITIALALIAEMAGIPLMAECFAAGSGLAFAIRLNSVLARNTSRPALLFPLSFLVLIAVTACLLKLPAATPPGAPIGWIDAVFTATSASCVTGLAVRDTASEFTFFGQAVILGAIQIGGLGVMIFGSTLALLLGARISFREHISLSIALDEYPPQRIARFTLFIVLTSLCLEAIGAAILFLSWPDHSLAWQDKLWMSVFHSISAFCNAGFDITGESMIGLRSHPALFIGIIPMIILGGIGFLVLDDIQKWVRSRLKGSKRPHRLSTHSRIVLATTAILLIAGALGIFLVQAARAETIGAQIALDAAFMSVTARTAGFTSVPMDELEAGSRFILMLLMTIGGSPGSTAGGMRTVVFALLVLAVVSTIRNRPEVEAFGRALPDTLVKRAATVAAGLFGVIALTILILDITESIPFEQILFEAISAATTTGLSLGATTELTDPGRVVITVTMFLGRIGALSLLSALLSSGRPSAAYQYPRDTVSLG